MEKVIAYRVASYMLSIMGLEFIAGRITWEGYKVWRADYHTAAAGLAD